MIRLDEKYNEKNLEIKNVNSIKSEDSCQICDSITNLHKHHPDYKRRNEIILLCSQCHRRVHEYKKNRKLKKGYTLYLDDEVIAELEKLGEKQKRSSSWLANEFLKERLEKEEKKK